LETAVMEEAWEKLAKRHAVLRTSFRWEGLAEPRQEAHPGIRVPFAQKDWAGSPAAEQKARLEALLQEERRQGFELTVAPLMRVVLIRKSEADFTLVWTYHHILLDARSLGILLKELFLIYEGLRQGSPVALASTKPYCGYIEWLQRQEWSEAEEFWRERLGGFSTATPLLAASAPANLNGHHSSMERERLGTRWKASLPAAGSGGGEWSGPGEH